MSSLSPARRATPADPKRERKPAGKKRPSAVTLWHALAVAVVLCAAAGYWLLPARQSIPAHMRGHPIVDAGQGFLDVNVVEGLLNMTRRIGRIRTASREYDSYATLADHIGEAVPPVVHEANGRLTCPEPFLMPNGDQTLCVFPGRSDVGRHYVRSGGIEARKEPFEVLVSRVQPFQTMLFNWSDYQVAEELMKDDKFVDLARAVCPKERQFLDPFQFNLVVQVPGQTVAAHIDAPIFRRATRKTLPQWLLAAMVFSGLFRSDFIDQVQLVGYYHKWTDADRAGKFYFWNDDRAVPYESDPVSGSANSVDGSKVVHAAGLYMPHRAPPVLSKDDKNELVYLGLQGGGDGNVKHMWGIEVNGVVRYTYPESDLRFSAVYRARCFTHAQAKEAFLDDVAKRPWNVDEVLRTFEKDMKRQGTWPFAATESVSSADVATPRGRYLLGLAIMDAYVRYPYSPTALLPFNYCALDRLVPALKPVLALVC